MRIETNRLIIREFIEADWEQVQAYASDAELVQFMEWGPNSEAATQEYIDRMLVSQKQTPRVTYEFAITLKANGLLIGGSGLHIEEYQQASLGYCFNRAFWGQGFATESAHALCEFGFSRLNLHRIYATCRPENVTSARIMEKLGMTKEGVLREHMFWKGKWQSSFIYGILASEFSLKSEPL
ncbi:GNAT family N-acetyltransferase [Alicyclobacillus sp. SO9]|uniref:GNAT family N-acetyltransferase n=1 Tax=Alicyclobacillus sp. SO9 TaxID=2665646 RepID=UPI0018E8C1BA|nr:GNAT family protein [Alicyclobacillus sp. SO9]QQE81396.1 GNAT family N-acetyltransferase [Alicyclobacillus sp. SO9]